MKDAEAIQARWEIEEKVIIFLSELMLNPPKAPHPAEKIMREERIGHMWDENIRTIGAIFCQVKRIAPWAQSINSITWGNQKWVGAIPIFTPKAIEINLLE